MRFFLCKFRWTFDFKAISVALELAVKIASVNWQGFQGDHCATCRGDIAEVSYMFELGGDF